MEEAYNRVVGRGAPGHLPLIHLVFSDALAEPLLSPSPMTRVSISFGLRTPGQRLEDTRYGVFTQRIQPLRSSPVTVTIP